MHARMYVALQPGVLTKGDMTSGTGGKDRKAPHACGMDVLCGEYKTERRVEHPVTWTKTAHPRVLSRIVPVKV